MSERKGGSEVGKSVNIEYVPVVMSLCSSITAVRT